MTKRERQRAQTLINRAIEFANEETIKRLLCAAIGHPPVVKSCFGQLTCARCEDIIGETLLSPGITSSRAIIGHDCSECREVWEGTTSQERLLTEPWSPGKLKSVPNTNEDRRRSKGGDQVS